MRAAVFAALCLLAINVEASAEIGSSQPTQTKSHSKQAKLDEFKKAQEERQRQEEEQRRVREEENRQRQEKIKEIRAKDQLAREADKRRAQEVKKEGETGSSTRKKSVENAQNLVKKKRYLDMLNNMKIPLTWEKVSLIDCDLMLDALKEYLQSTKIDNGEKKCLEENMNEVKNVKNIQQKSKETQELIKSIHERKSQTPRRDTEVMNFINIASLGPGKLEEATRAFNRMPPEKKNEIPDFVLVVYIRSFGVRKLPKQRPSVDKDNLTLIDVATQLSNDLTKEVTNDLEKFLEQTNPAEKLKSADADTLQRLEKTGNALADNPLVENKKDLEGILKIIASAKDQIASKKEADASKEIMSASTAAAGASPAQESSSAKTSAQEGASGNRTDLANPTIDSASGKDRTVLEKEGAELAKGSIVESDTVAQASISKVNLEDSSLYHSILTDSEFFSGENNPNDSQVTASSYLSNAAEPKSTEPPEIAEKPIGGAEAESASPEKQKAEADSTHRDKSQREEDELRQKQLEERQKKEDEKQRLKQRIEELKKKQSDLIERKQQKKAKEQAEKQEMERKRSELNDKKDKYLVRRMKEILDAARQENHGGKVEALITEGKSLIATFEVWKFPKADTEEYGNLKNTVETLEKLSHEMQQMADALKAESKSEDKTPQYLIKLLENSLELGKKCDNYGLRTISTSVGEIQQILVDSILAAQAKMSLSEQIELASQALNLLPNNLNLERELLILKRRQAEEQQKAKAAEAIAQLSPLKDSVKEAKSILQLETIVAEVRLLKQTHLSSDLQKEAAEVVQKANAIILAKQARIASVKDLQEKVENKMKQVGQLTIEQLEGIKEDLKSIDAQLEDLGQDAPVNSITLEDRQRLYQVLIEKRKNAANLKQEEERKAEEERRIREEKGREEAKKSAAKELQKREAEAAAMKKLKDFLLRASNQNANLDELKALKEEGTALKSEPILKENASLHTALEAINQKIKEASEAEETRKRAEEEKLRKEEERRFEEEAERRRKEEANELIRQQELQKQVEDKRQKEEKLKKEQEEEELRKKLKKEEEQRKMEQERQARIASVKESQSKAKERMEQVGQLSLADLEGIKKDLDVINDQLKSLENGSPADSVIIGTREIMNVLFEMHKEAVKIKQEEQTSAEEQQRIREAKERAEAEKSAAEESQGKEAEEKKLSMEKEREKEEYERHQKEVADGIRRQQEMQREKALKEQELQMQAEQQRQREEADRNAREELLRKQQEEAHLKAKEQERQREEDDRRAREEMLRRQREYGEIQAKQQEVQAWKEVNSAAAIEKQSSDTESPVEESAEEGAFTDDEGKGEEDNMEKILDEAEAMNRSSRSTVQQLEGILKRLYPWKNLIPQEKESLIKEIETKIKTLKTKPVTNSQGEPKLEDPPKPQELVSPRGEANSQESDTLVPDEMELAPVEPLTAKITNPEPRKTGTLVKVPPKAQPSLASILRGFKFVSRLQSWRPSIIPEENPASLSYTKPIERPEGFSHHQIPGNGKPNVLHYL